MSEPTLGDAIPRIIECAEKVLEWMPKCSPGSSGYVRAENLRMAIQELEGAWGLARL